MPTHVYRRHRSRVNFTRRIISWPQNFEIPTQSKVINLYSYINMPPKRQPGHEERLQQALEQLSLDPTLRIPQAAGRYGVAERTLHNRKNKGRQSSQKAHLKECILNPAQEQALVKWACFQDDRGIPPRLDLLKDKAQAILQEIQPGQALGKRWMDRFIKRHSELQTRFSQRLERQRSVASNPRVLEHHFRLFEKALKEYKIKEVNIWNMDEKGFLLGIAAKVKVVCRKGRKNPKYSQDGNRELITVLESVSSKGVALPPLVVTKGANHYFGNHIRGQGVPGWVYAHSPNGWTSNEIGLAWLEEHFEPLTCPEFVTPFFSSLSSFTFTPAISIALKLIVELETL